MAVIVPGAEWRPAPARALLARLDAVIFHTIVGTVAGALPGRHYHIYVRADGSFVQIHSLDRRSAASVDANPYSIAIVCEDKGPAFPVWSGNDVPAYTDAQVATLIYLLAWIMEWSGLPMRLLEDSCIGPNNQGIGWHRLGIEGNFPSAWPYCGHKGGCQHWSTEFGKGCPGPRRIDQLVYTVFPAVANPGGNMAQLDDIQKYVTDTFAVIQGVVVPSITVHTATSTASVMAHVQAVATSLAVVRAQTDTLEATDAAQNARLAAIEAKLVTLIDMVGALEPGGGGSVPVVYEVTGTAVPRAGGS